MERETLTEWPTSPLQDAVEWWLYVTAPHDDRIPGRFRYDDHGRVVFECEDGTALGAGTFEDGERFEPCEAPEPDPRIAALEGENAALKASAEANADAVSEHAAISALMAADPVLCRYGMLEAFEMLKARADEACGEPAPPVVDRDALRDAIADALGSSAYDCARVWSAWSYGTMSQDDFRHLVDDEDRLMEIVDAVVGVLKVTPEPAPLRLGRGPTVEEVEAVAAKESDGLGWWMLNFDGDGIAWEVCSLHVEDGAVLLDSGMSVYGFHDITDAIPLSASRHPCGVGVTQGQAMADAFKDLAQRQTSLGAAASAAITAQDLWDMHDTGEKETP